MKRVLIVDDEPAIRGILVRVLEREGYHVEEAEDGAVAEAAVTRASGAGEAFDLLLLDVHMPVMDGVALYHHLTERGICPPTVVMTGDPHGPRLQSLTGDDNASLLEKPFVARTVLDVIASMLD